VRAHGGKQVRYWNEREDNYLGWSRNGREEKMRHTVYVMKEKKKKKKLNIHNV
jgi:hypothetical protein